MDNPDLIRDICIDEQQTQIEHFNWYYSGRTPNSWWKYDKRTNTEIENAFKLFVQDPTKSQFDIRICDNVYEINFKSSLQIRKDNSNLKRSIKRDIKKIENLRGIAGITVATIIVSSDKKTKTKKQ